MSPFEIITYVDLSSCDGLFLMNSSQTLTYYYHTENNVNLPIECIVLMHVCPRYVCIGCTCILQQISQFPMQKRQFTIWEEKSVQLGKGGYMSETY